MISRYADITLSDGYDLADDWLGNGGMPEMEQTGLQVSRPIGADYVKIRARGQRQNTITLVVTSPPFASIGAAFTHALLFPATLPGIGLLEITMEGLLVSFANAALKSCKPEHRGLTNIYTLVFLAGPPSGAVALSPLALMNPLYIANLNRPEGINITSLTGGTTDDLDHLPTADVTLGFTALLWVAIDGVRQRKAMTLITGTAATNTDTTAGALVVRPLDFHVTTNPKIWVE